MLSLLQRILQLRRVDTKQKKKYKSEQNYSQKKQNMNSK